MAQITEKIIGVDIGSDAVKAVLLERQGQGTCCLGTLIHSFPDGNGHTPEQLHEALQAVRAKFGNATVRTAVIISDRQVQLKFFNKPDMPPDYLEIAVANEMKQGLTPAEGGDGGTPGEIPVWTTTVLGRTKIENGARTQLHLVGAVAPKSLLFEQQKLFAAAGLQLCAIIPYPIALRECLRSAVLDPRPADAEPSLIGVVNLGASTNQIAVFDHSLLYLARIFPSAGEDLTRQLAKTWRVGNQEMILDRERAEEYKRAIGVMTIEEVSRYEATALEPQVSLALSRAIERMAQKIRLSLDYLKGQMRASVDHVHLVGGGANMRGVGKHLDDLLGTHTHSFNPMARMTFAAVDQQAAIPTAEELATLSPAFGTALAALLPDDQNLNLFALIATQTMKKIKAFLQKALVPLAWIGVVAVPVLLYTLLVYWPVGSELGDLSNKLGEANAALGELATEKGKYDRLQKEQKDLALRSQFLQKRLGQKVFWSRLLLEVGKVTPDRVWLTQWQSLAPAVPSPEPTRPVAGAAATKNAPVPGIPAVRFQLSGVAGTYDDLALFIQRLEDSALFSSVKWEESSAEGKDSKEAGPKEPRRGRASVAFKIVCVVAPTKLKP